MLKVPTRKVEDSESGYSIAREGSYYGPATGERDFSKYSIKSGKSDQSQSSKTREDSKNHIAHSPMVRDKHPGSPDETFPGYKSKNSSNTLESHSGFKNQTFEERMNFSDTATCQIDLFKT